MNHVPEAPQSASGDYAWLGAEPGSVADQLYMSAADEWNQAINSRFVNELLDDTLPESILKSYLIQDFKFFNQGIMAHAIELAPRQETKDMLAKQSQWFADNEATYFTGFLKEYGITDEEYNNSEQTPANREYCEYLTKLVQELGKNSLLRCAAWNGFILPGPSAPSTLASFSRFRRTRLVDLHEGDYFRAWTGRLIALVNEYASVDGSEADVFRTIVHLERRFFEDSYPQR